MQANLMELQEYKRKEYLGDAILTLLAREFFLTDWSRRAEQRDNEFDIQSNKILGEIGKRIGIEPAPFDNGKKSKRYANAVEVRLCEYYLNDGLDGARKFFTETMCPLYGAIKSEKRELTYKLINQ